MANGRHALLVGINRYPNFLGAELRGCLNDVELMRHVLVERFGFLTQNIRLLVDSHATRNSILNALDELTSKAGHDDRVVLYYAGHGSRVAAPHQENAYIESIVPYDSGRGKVPNRDILDVEIDRWVQKVNEKTSFVTLIFDCCHAGSVTRDVFGEAARRVSPDDRPPRGALMRAAARGVRRGERWLSGRRRAVLIAACREHELAHEHRKFDGERVLIHGAMTYLLGRTLLRTDSGTTWRDVFEDVAPQLTSRYPGQHPELEGKLDEHCFGTRMTRSAGYLLARPLAVGGVKLLGGAAHGVVPGSLWSVRSRGAKHRSAGRELCRIQIESVGAASSLAQVCAGSMSRSAGSRSRAFLLEQKLALRLGVTISAPESMAAAAADLRRLVQDSKLLEVAAEKTTADVLVRLLPPRKPLSQSTWEALGRDGRLATRPRPDGENGRKCLVQDLVNAARYRHILGIENPDVDSRVRGRIRLTMRRWRPLEQDFVRAMPGPGDGPIRFLEGDTADFEIHNDADRPVWVTLAELGCDGKVSLLMPMPGHATYRQGGKKLEPGETVRLAGDYLVQDPKYAGLGLDRGLRLRLPNGFPWAAEPRTSAPSDCEETGRLYLKLFVTGARADFEFLLQGATRRVPRHPLERLTYLYSSGRGDRSFQPPASDVAPEMDWTTLTLPIEVSRRSANPSESFSE